jgi:hypothetical protein
MKKQLSIMKIEYEPDYDTLSITFETSQNTLCWEAPNGVLYRIDPYSERLLGITILGFSNSSKNNGSFDLSPFFDLTVTRKFKARCAQMRKAHCTQMRKMENLT